MWFKQLSLFSFSERFTFSHEQCQEKLAALAFHPCLPSHPESHGWISPTNVSEELVFSLNDCLLFCMNSEEKILPSIVINQTLTKKIAERELETQKKVYSKEKLQMKEDLVLELLPKAFSKHSKTFAYIDKKQQWLLIGTTQLRKVEKILFLLKKSFGIETQPVFNQQNSFSFLPFIQNDAPAFGIQPNYILQDPQNITREIRCKQQDIYEEPMQSLLKQYQVKQLALNWQDQVSFQIKQNGDLQGLRYSDELIHETADADDQTQTAKTQADFFILTNTLRKLISDLLEINPQASNANTTKMDAFLAATQAMEMA